MVTLLPRTQNYKWPVFIKIYLLQLVTTLLVSISLVEVTSLHASFWVCVISVADSLETSGGFVSSSFGSEESKLTTSVGTDWGSSTISSSEESEPWVSFPAGASVGPFVSGGSGAPVSSMLSSFTSAAAGGEEQESLVRRRGRSLRIGREGCLASGSESLMSGCVLPCAFLRTLFFFNFLTRFPAVASGLLCPCCVVWEPFGETGLSEVLPEFGYDVSSSVWSWEARWAWCAGDSHNLWSCAHSIFFGHSCTLRSHFKVASVTNSRKENR